MNTLTRFIILSLFLVVNITTYSQSNIDIPESIITALKSGNSVELAKLFNNNIELTLLDKEEVYSKSQAELILKDFFSKNPPTGFTILHKGGKEGSKYAIGNLNTSKKNYRVYFLIKNINNKQLIQQLRIENSDE